MNLLSVGTAYRMVVLVSQEGVVKAGSVACQMLTHSTERWFCELDGIVDSVRE